MVKKHYTNLFLFLCLIIVFTGCTIRDDFTPSPLIGTWRPVSVIRSGVNVTAEYSAFVLKFNDELDYTITKKNGVIGFGEWKQLKQTIILTPDGQLEKAKLVEKKLVFEYDDNDGKAVFTMTK